jgi:hypothetical protein
MNMTKGWSTEITRNVPLRTASLLSKMVVILATLLGTQEQIRVAGPNNKTQETTRASKKTPESFTNSQAPLGALSD